MRRERDVPASVDDSVVGVACGLEGRAEELGVELLVLRLVVLGICGRGELSGSQVTTHHQFLSSHCGSSATYKAFQPAMLVDTPRTWLGEPAALYTLASPSAPGLRLSFQPNQPP
jgi:hypothetical protein